MSAINKLKKPETPEDLDRLVKLVLFYKNPYDILMSDATMPLDTIKSHYKKLVLWLHPDKCKHEQTTEAITALSQAMKAVENEEVRESYSQLHERAVKSLRNKWRSRGKRCPLDAKKPKDEEYYEEEKDEKEEGKEKENNEEEEELLIEWEYDLKKTIHAMIVENEAKVNQAQKTAQSNTEYTEEQREAEREKYKSLEEQAKAWEETSEIRIANWRDFQKGSMKRPLGKVFKKKEVKRAKIEVVMTSAKSRKAESKLADVKDSISNGETKKEMTDEEKKPKDEKMKDKEKQRDRDRDRDRRKDKERDRDRDKDRTDSKHSHSHRSSTHSHHSSSHHSPHSSHSKHSSDRSRSHISDARW